MNITYHNWRSADPHTIPVERYVADAIINGYDYESRGIAEEASARARRAAEAIGKLCDILATKGILNVEDVVDIAGAYSTIEKVKPIFAP